MATSKSFNLTMKSAKSFIIVIKDFVVSDSWTLLVKQISRLTGSLKGQLNNTFNLIVKGTRLTFSGRVKVYPSISLTNKANVITTMRSQIKMFANFINGIALTIVMKLRSTISTAMNEMKFNLAFSPLLASFFSLSSWDASTLSSLDSSDLGSLDFTAT